LKNGISFPKKTKFCSCAPPSNRSHYAGIHSVLAGLNNPLLMRPCQSVELVLALFFSFCPIWTPFENRPVESPSLTDAVSRDHEERGPPLQSVDVISFPPGPPQMLLEHGRTLIPLTPLPHRTIVFSSFFLPRGRS